MKSQHQETPTAEIRSIAIWQTFHQSELQLTENLIPFAYIKSYTAAFFGHTAEVLLEYLSWILKPGIGINFTTPSCKARVVALLLYHNATMLQLLTVLL